MPRRQRGWRSGVRGPGNDGPVPAGVRVPEAPPGAPEVIWRKAVGPAMASPVISGGRVYHMDAQAGPGYAHP
jgi:hypothetical protein